MIASLSASQRTAAGQSHREKCCLALSGAGELRPHDGAGGDVGAAPEEAPRGWENCPQTPSEGGPLSFGCSAPAPAAPHGLLGAGCCAACAAGGAAAAALGPGGRLPAEGPSSRGFCCERCPPCEVAGDAGKAPRVCVGGGPGWLRDGTIGDEFCCRRHHSKSQQQGEHWLGVSSYTISLAIGFLRTTGYDMPICFVFSLTLAQTCQTCLPSMLMLPLKEQGRPAR